MQRSPTLDRRHFLGAAGLSLAGLAGCTSSGDDDDPNDSDDGDNPNDSSGNGDGTSDDEPESVSTPDDASDDDGETDSSDDSGDDNSNETDSSDDESDLEAAAQEYDTESYEGTDVPLVPLEDAVEWYEAGDARFVDTRGQVQYAETRIEGAYFSPAPDGLDEDDPVAEWPTDELVVTYCACPHDIAVRRAAMLAEEGYENVFVLEGGLEAWDENGHPVAGASTGD